MLQGDAPVMRTGFFLLPLLVMACTTAPPTPERALRQCRAEAPLADGISGSVGAGISNRGPVGDGSITITNRVFDPQSEDEYITDCIDRVLNGRPPPTTYAISMGRRR